MFAENNEPQINFDSIQGTSESKSRRQLAFALALLVTALVLVVLKNRQFWVDTLGLEEILNQTPSETIQKTEHHVNPSSSRKTVARQNASRPEVHTGVLPGSQETALIPLQVDVTYSSGQHETLVARDSGLHIDLQQNPNFPSAMAANATSPGNQTGVRSTGAVVHFSGQTMEILGRPVEPIYPALAQQENVQGAVVLQAQVGEDGNVQALKVISGPPLLTAAALEAVRQWHFKPQHEGGEAVPSETRITVNFTISTQ
jgi:TonB family protein